MRSPQYFNVLDWNTEPSYRKSLIRSLLKRHIQCALAIQGHNGHFDSLSEMFEVLNIGRVRWQSIHVLVRTIDHFGRPTREDLPMFYMSYRSFRRLLRETPGIRLESNSWLAAERDDVPRCALYIQ